jgi:sporulation protein YlmC with PRC-barrel domain
MTRIAPLILSFSLLAFAGAAAAQQTQRQGASGDQPAAGATAKTSGAMSAKRLIGTDVVDAQGKDMGEIKEIVLDLHNGRVHAAVVEFGGFLGIGDNQYAFSPSELRPAKERDQLMLNVSKDQLKDRQGFEKEKWPAMSDEYWSRTGGKAAAGATKAQGQSQKVNLHRASKLIGQDVQNKNGEQVGELSDIVFSAERDRIQHLVVKRNDGGEARIAPKQVSLGTGDKLMIDMPAGKGKQGSASAGGTSSAAAAPKRFAELDRDNDEALSRMEAAADANAKSNFDRLDKNQDQKLSRDEWEHGQVAAGGNGAKAKKR